MKKYVGISMMVLSLSCKKKEPIMYFHNKLSNFGVALHDQATTAFFVVSNKGTDDLRISRIITDCRCTLASDSILTVKPHQTDTIKVTYTGDMHDIGLTVERDILIEANTKPAYVHLKLIGKVL